MSDKPGFECACPNCRRACSRKPGWFLPGQAERLAKNLGMPLQELFETKLAVDFFGSSVKHRVGKTIWVLAPATKHMIVPGNEYPLSPYGECVFYENGRCEIHEMGKPFECAAMDHGDNGGADHREVAMAWQDHEQQRQIRELLGREPEEPRPVFPTMMSFSEAIEAFSSLPFRIV